MKTPVKDRTVKQHKPGSIRMPNQRHPSMSRETTLLMEGIEIGEMITMPLHAPRALKQLKNIPKFIRSFKGSNSVAKSLGNISLDGLTALSKSEQGALKGGTRFLDDFAEASEFGDDILNINMRFNDGSLLNGSPGSAINSASYYDDVLDQGAAIFKSISHGHMFSNGNKRTAVEVFKLFAEKSGITINASNDNLLDIATQVATGKLTDITEIGAALTK